MYLRLTGRICLHKTDASHKNMFAIAKNNVILVNACASENRTKCLEERVITPIAEASKKRRERVLFLHKWQELWRESGGGLPLTI
jgi:hypothetical protein